MSDATTAPHADNTTVEDATTSDVDATQVSENTTTEGAAPQPEEGVQGSGLPDDPEQLKNIIHALRAENAGNRVNAKTRAAEEARTQLIEEIGRALGLGKDENTPPTVEDITRQLAGEQQARSQAETQLAVYKAAHAAGADPEILLDSASFHAAIKDTDTADAVKLTETIRSFIKDNPRFASQVVGASTVEHAAGSGENTVTPAQFRAMTMQQRIALRASDPSTYERLVNAR